MSAPPTCIRPARPTSWSCVIATALPNPLTALSLRRPSSVRAVQAYSGVARTCKPRVLWQNRAIMRAMLLRTQAPVATAPLEPAEVTPPTPGFGEVPVRAGDVRLRHPAEVRRRGGRAPALRRHHRLPGSATEPARAGRAPRPLRVRLLGPHHATDRPALGLPGVRLHP